MARSAGVEEYSRAFGHETHDDRLMFEFLLVGVFQVGMNWQVAASKLPVYRRVFANLDIKKVAAMDLENIDAIMADPDMIHNQRKIRAVIKNARAIVSVQQEYGSFANYMWQFVDGVPHTKTYENEDEVEMTTPFAGTVAKDMKQHGFTFVGPTVTYLFMKASGMIQDQVLNR
ncbi:DNA-3-methyladenine glycosylase I [Furfurilactobacillus siliginis]|uniref:3-methyladenine DNA glycosylase n=1 Tax=Furfurilactobacillus siliginis TaxID=348151 RepID=A0A0R2L6K0_9LACO|nr:DNA-3-methyladenine glycosylase I [Furfurilactobacillus siliginis]KRN96976.1 3-methyladenine DNA glycosylase [Furfurilactobacillus siliginis]GEK27735.1 DNA-3-methyladenine glycosylase I [Furfurilactobacillus siliginis]